MVSVYRVKSLEKAREIRKEALEDPEVERVEIRKTDGCFEVRIIWFDDEGERRWFGNYSFIQVIYDECKGDS